MSDQDEQYTDLGVGEESVEQPGESTDSIGDAPELGADDDAPTQVEEQPEGSEGSGDLDEIDDTLSDPEDEDGDDEVVEVVEPDLDSEPGGFSDDDPRSPNYAGPNPGLAEREQIESD